MKNTLSLLGLLGLSQPALAEDSPIRIPIVDECSVGDRLYRIENPDSIDALFQVYTLPNPTEKVLVDSFPMYGPDSVFGRRLDFLLNYSRDCEEKK